MRLRYLRKFLNISTLKNGRIKRYYKEDPIYIKNVTTDNTHVVQMLNSFIHNGPNGKHFSMVFEIMGVTLLEIIKRYNYKGVKSNSMIRYPFHTFV